jgi:CheY-like chemotaxis protein
VTETGSGCARNAGAPHSPGQPTKAEITLRLVLPRAVLERLSARAIREERRLAANTPFARSKHTFHFESSDRIRYHLVMARILLIEDDDSVRTMLRLTLVHCGHTVIEARNGVEGLARFQHANADLVITDIVMPEKDGLEVVMELRGNHPSVKIIAISGADSGGDYLDSARLMGAAKVLLKPFTNEVLIAAINDVLPE